MKKSFLFLSLWICQAWALSCSAPVTFSGLGEVRSCAKTAINDKGEAVVVWKAEPETNSCFLQATTCDIEKKWSAVEKIGDIEQEAIGPVELYMDHEGNAFAGWVGQKKKNQFYKFSKKEKENWCPVITIVSSEDKIMPVAVHFDLQGNLIILGLQAPETFNFIHYLQKTETKNVKKFPFSGLFPFQIVCHKDGQVAAGCIRKEIHNNWFSTTTDYKIQQVSLKESGEWTAPVTLGKLGWIEGSNMPAGKPFCSMNSNGNFAFISSCKDMNTQDMKVEAIVSTPGDETGPIPLATSKQAFDNSKILIDDQGNTLAAWTGLLKNRKAVFAAYKPKGQPWTSPMPLTDSQKIVKKFELSYQQGHFIVVWDEVSLKNDYSIYGATFSPQTQEWSLALLSPPDQDCMEPSIAFNEKGEGIIAWTHWSGKKQFDIQVAELKID